MARGHSSNELSKIIRLSDIRVNHKGQHHIEWIKPVDSIIILSNISLAPYKANELLLLIDIESSLRELLDGSTMESQDFLLLKVRLSARI